MWKEVLNTTIEKRSKPEKKKVLEEANTRYFSLKIYILLSLYLNELDIQFIIKLGWSKENHNQVKISQNGFKE